MMNIIFIGVGEAFDPQYGNASYLIESETRLLIDCGYAVPRNLFAQNLSPDHIDAIYITHFHADHCFGIPPVLYRWNEEGRTKPLTFIGQPGTKDHLNRVMELAYPTMLKKLRYELHFIENNTATTYNEFELAFAKTEHSIPNYAVKVNRVGFSGDGALTEESKLLFEDCEILVHDSFRLEQAMRGHASALDVLEYARTLPNLRDLVLVHLHRDERAERLDAFAALNDQVPFNVIIPEPGEVMTASSSAD